MFGKCACFLSVFAQSCECPWCAESEPALLARQPSAKCAGGPTLMIVFYIFQLRPHSGWAAIAVTQAESWAAVLKQPQGLLMRWDCSPVEAGEGGACQHASGSVHGYAGWSLGLSGLEGGQSVVEWLQESDTLHKQPAGSGCQVLFNTSKSCISASCSLRWGESVLSKEPLLFTYTRGNSLIM